MHFQLELLSEDDELKSLPATKNESVHAIRVYSVQVTSHKKTWVVRRSFENFEFLDRQAHQCIFDRKYSQLPLIPQEENVTPTNGQSHKVGIILFFYKLSWFKQGLFKLIRKCSNELQNDLLRISSF